MMGKKIKSPNPLLLYSNIPIYMLCVHPCAKKFGVCRGALLRARTEFGVKDDKTLFLTLGILGISNFRHSYLYYCFVKSSILVRRIWVENASLKSPPTPL